MFVKFYSQALV